MGWKLAEEIAWARPERPGPEWWTLLDIAQDARDESRQGIPGHEYLMSRGKCSRATIYRRLKALTDAGLIKVIKRPAPGFRAVYEVAIMHGTGLTIAETRSPVDNPGTGLTTGLTGAETCSEINGSQDEAQRVSLSGQRVSQELTPHPSLTPVTTHPSTPNSPVVTGPVEGSGASFGQDHQMSAIERAARQAATERLRRERQEA